MKKGHVFYQLEREVNLNGQGDYVDITGKLHHFLGSETLGIRAEFRLKSSGYCTLLSVYYKESLLPDFSVNVNKGYLTITTKHQGVLQVISDTVASNDGEIHRLVVNGDENGIAAWIDGRKAICKPQLVPYCDYGYVGFAAIGRGAVQNHHGSFWEGDILSLELSETAFGIPEEGRGKAEIEKKVLFGKGMAGSVNYRIPSVITTVSGTVIATADARYDAPGDNPNHILRAVRLSYDSGQTWKDIVLSTDFGGVGREDGAAAVDGQLVQDQETKTVFMLYGHTKGGIGSQLSQPGTGFDDLGRRCLNGKDGGLYYQEKNGEVVDECGEKTGYTVDSYDRLFLNGIETGSVCHGEDALFSIASTSFLQIIESHDDGRTWSEPRDLNTQVKLPWMRFLGPGPGIGICMGEGDYRGRLVCPVYYSNKHDVYSNGTIYSDDHGVTWKLGKSVNDGRVIDGVAIEAADCDKSIALLGESQLMELPGGRLRFFIRNPHYQHIITADSDDGGETWNRIRVEDQLVNPDCQCSVLRIPEGYLFAGSNHENLRVKGTIRFSPDGSNWSEGSLLECGEFAYSCMTMLPDGNIGILYEGLDISQYFAKFPVSWIY